MTKKYRILGLLAVFFMMGQFALAQDSSKDYKWSKAIFGDTYGSDMGPGAITDFDKARDPVLGPRADYVTPLDLARSGIVQGLADGAKDLKTVVIGKSQIQYQEGMTWMGQLLEGVMEMGAGTLHTVMIPLKLMVGLLGAVETLGRDPGASYLMTKAITDGVTNTAAIATGAVKTVFGAANLATLNLPQTIVEAAK